MGISKPLKSNAAAAAVATRIGSGDRKISRPVLAAFISEIPSTAFSGFYLPFKWKISSGICKQNVAENAAKSG